MLDHLLLNKLKWFNIDNNADTVSANGKTWTAHPASIVIKDETNIIAVSIATDILFSGYNLTAVGQQTVKCIAKKNGWYAICGYVHVTDDTKEFNKNAFIDIGLIRVDSTNLIDGKPNVISENWGGKSPLFFIWRAFTRFKKGAEVC